MVTPGRSPAATINAMPMASHDRASGNTRKRGRSGCQAVDWPYAGPGSLDITLSFAVGGPSSPFLPFAPAVMDLLAQRLPARPRFAGDLVPLPLDLVFGGPFAPPDAAELLVDLPAGRRRADDDDHEAEEPGDHGEDRADHAVAGGVRVEEVRDPNRRA